MTFLDNNPYYYMSNSILDFVNLTKDELGQLAAASVIMQYSETCSINTTTGRHLNAGSAITIPADIV